ncbi:MAG: extracellular solute-binding protein, partial [Chloroflexi bacterium]|nr:extracellular solute-binding protein [Chloroflexota bacterium]
MGTARYYPALEGRRSMEQMMSKRTFTRRRFFATFGQAAGVVGVAFAAAGCSSVQQTLGPKSGGSGGTASGSAPSSGTTAGAAGSNSGGAGAGGAAATLRYMGHFTALGDTARDRAQKQIDEKFKAKAPNITIQWEQTAWETIGEKYMAAWSAGTAPDISLFSPANITQAVRLGSLEDLQPSFSKWADSDRNDLSKAWW